MTIAQSTTIQAYQLRKGGTPARMAILRMIAADRVNNCTNDARLYIDWRAARSWTLGSYAAAYCSGINQGASHWYTHGGEQFRNETDANDVRGGPSHRGWFCDVDCQEKAIGIVAQLTHGRYIAGYRWTSNDERVYFGEVFTDESDAARMADEHARVFAESSREDSERYEVMALAELDCEEKLLEVQKAFALRHRAKFGGTGRVHRCISGLREAREQLTAAKTAYERG